MATILIIDDRALNRELLETLLSYQGHRVLEATDGATGLAQVRAQRPDLVISDLLMPTMDGFEFVRQLRADPEIADTPVIFASAHYLKEESRQLAEACGIATILSKPCEPETILRVVAEALGGRSPVAPPTPLAEFDRAHLQVLTDKLAQKVDELRQSSSRLEALIDAGLSLSSQWGTETLLNSLCDEARSLSDARYVCILETDAEGQPQRHTASSGMSAEMAAQIAAQLPWQGAICELFAQRRAFRLYHPAQDRLAPLPDSSSNALLSVPIVSPLRPYGWLCLAGKVAGGPFGEADERLAGTLAALIGRVYESEDLCRQVQCQAKELKRQSAECEQAEAAARQLSRELEQRLAERNTQYCLEANGAIPAGEEQIIWAHAQE